MKEKGITPTDLVARYARGPALLEKAVSGLAESDYDLAESTGGWTIRQYVHHTADADELWKVFLKRALGNSGGKFDLWWYVQAPEQEYWAQAWMYASRSIAPSLALFRANRATITQLLRAVPGALDKCLNYCYKDGRVESVSVREIIEMQTFHAEEHVGNIRHILAARQGS